MKYTDLLCLGLFIILKANATYILFSLVDQF